MTITKVNPHVSKGTFIGLSKQNLLFHQALGELIDNSVAAFIDKDKPCVVNILIRQYSDKRNYDLYLFDNSSGMDIEELKGALDLGRPPISNSRLNEHGFGMKNAIATLTSGVNAWQIWTKTKNGPLLSVKGPFDTEMYISDDEPLPSEFVEEGVSTLTYVEVSPECIQSVQGRGSKAIDINSLKSWIIEHLGVMYRGLLEPTPERKYVPRLMLMLKTIKDEDIREYNIYPAKLPMAYTERKRIKVTIEGQVLECLYEYGTLDEEAAREGIIIAEDKKEKFKYYYQGNQKTQGIDISIDGRVIATKQFESIWKGSDGESLKRHNDYNGFIGELKIPKVDRGILSTINNKTDFNINDPGWSDIFAAMADYKPIKNIKSKSEEQLKQEWIKHLKETNPEDEIDDEHYVWESGARIDVYRKTPHNEIFIYELKVGKATPLHLYQLKMYWDGLVLQGIQPTKGILLVESYKSTIKSMAQDMSKFLSPPMIKMGEEMKPSGRYNFSVETHSERGLAKSLDD